MEGLGALVQSVVHDNTCNVCLEVTPCCLRLGCGHPFCDGCLEGLLAAGVCNRCPVCRRPVRTGVVFAECLAPSLARLAGTPRETAVAACPDAAPLFERAGCLGRRWARITPLSRLERGGDWPAALLSPAAPARSRDDASDASDSDVDDSDSDDDSDDIVVARSRAIAARLRADRLRVGAAAWVAGNSLYGWAALQQAQLDHWAQLRSANIALDQ